MTNLQQRGLALEGVLNDLFKIDGLSVRDAFAIKRSPGIWCGYMAADVLGPGP